MSLRYLFMDLDNTICKSKQLVELSMLRELEIMNGSFKIGIVSGAEYSRMITQAPLNYVLYMAQNGNETWDSEVLLWKNELRNKDQIFQHIVQIATALGVRIENDMINDRGSQISFSFVGHHAEQGKKDNFDPDRKIRIALLDKFPFPGAVIGGTTCIDYIPFTKGQNIQRYLDKKKIKQSDCLYIGDAFMPYGNDATVMGVIPTFQVEPPLGTYNFIKQLYDPRYFPSR